MSLYKGSKFLEVWSSSFSIGFDSEENKKWTLLEFFLAFGVLREFIKEKF